MSAALEACRDYYARFSTPATLSENHCAGAIMRASHPVSAPDPQGDTMALAGTLSDCLWELAAESPEDGWEWTNETRSYLDQAQALILQSLEILKRAHEREGPRFREWYEHMTRAQEARSNVVSIRGRRAHP